MSFRMKFLLLALIAIDISAHGLASCPPRPPDALTPPDLIEMTEMPTDVDQYVVPFTLIGSYGAQVANLTAYERQYIDKMTTARMAIQFKRRDAPRNITNPNAVTMSFMNIMFDNVLFKNFSTPFAYVMRNMPLGKSMTIPYASTEKDDYFLKKDNASSSENMTLELPLEFEAALSVAYKILDAEGTDNVFSKYDIGFFQYYAVGGSVQEYWLQQFKIIIPYSSITTDDFNDTNDAVIHFTSAMSNIRESVPQHSLSPYWMNDGSGSRIEFVKTDPPMAVPLIRRTYELNGVQVDSLAANKTCLHKINIPKVINQVKYFGESELYQELYSAKEMGFIGNENVTICYDRWYAFVFSDCIPPVCQLQLREKGAVWVEIDDDLLSELNGNTFENRNTRFLSTAMFVRVSTENIGKFLKGAIPNLSAPVTILYGKDSLNLTGVHFTSPAEKKVDIGSLHDMRLYQADLQIVKPMERNSSLDFSLALPPPDVGYWKNMTTNNGYSFVTTDDPKLFIKITPKNRAISKIDVPNFLEAEPDAFVVDVRLKLDNETVRGAVEMPLELAYKISLYYEYEWKRAQSNTQFATEIYDAFNDFHSIDDLFSLYTVSYMLCTKRDDTDKFVGTLIFYDYEIVNSKIQSYPLHVAKNLETVRTIGNMPSSELGSLISREVRKEVEQYITKKLHPVSCEEACNIKLKVVMVMLFVFVLGFSTPFICLAVRYHSQFKHMARYEVNSLPMENRKFTVKLPPGRFLTTEQVMEMMSAPPSYHSSQAENQQYEEGEKLEEVVYADHKMKL